MIFPTLGDITAEKKLFIVYVTFRVISCPRRDYLSSQQNDIIIGFDIVIIMEVLMC